MGTPQNGVSKPAKTCHCGKSFAKTEHLERHKRSHTQEKPFRCAVCNKAFGRQDSLLRHTRSHTRERGDERSKSIAAASTAQVTKGGHAVSEPMLGRHSANEASDDSGRDQSGSMHDVSENSVSPAEAVAQWPNTNTQIDTLGDSLQDMSTWTFTQGHLMDQSWLLGNDFDANALDDSVAAAIASWTQARPIDSPFQPANNTSAVIMQELDSEGDSPVPIKAAAAVQNKWYTTITPSVSVPHGAPERTEEDHVTEAYRSSLSSHLRAQMSDDALPSADFLNLCINLYFANFHPLFPVVHAPTFRPSTEKALILLSICSIGAALVGSSQATMQGRKIFQKLNKAILSSWERYINRKQEEVLYLAQAAVIGQTFALMSGHSTDLYLAESFHGTVIAWARRSGMFRLNRSPLQNDAEDAAALNSRWIDWTHAEAKSRLSLALHLHDSLFSSIFHHEPLLRHDAYKLPQCGTDDSYNACSSAEWLRSMMNPGPPRFRAYVILSGLLASINEARQGQTNIHWWQKYEQALVAWRSENDVFLRNAAEDRYCLMILWHEACMALHTDFDTIETFVGREGIAESEAVGDKINWWASTKGRTCVDHALQIRSHVELLPARREPAIHVPRSLFFAGLVVFAYVRSIRSTGSQTPTLPNSNMHGASRATSHGLTSNTSETRITDNPNVDLGAVCNIADLLRRVGHWQLSRKFASILDPLLDDVPQGLR